MGCYSISAGACINIEGGEVVAERVGFAASLSTVCATFLAARCLALEPLAVVPSGSHSH